mmetsp:Transcript_13251/g.41926  ORF Transcript_13251/g.41926 Transcript_13251/m.41926 type:complete len:83 (+) Transcript_13251:3-251(+)
MEDEDGAEEDADEQGGAAGMDGDDGGPRARDAEAEAELAENLTNDEFADYDISVDLEGSAIDAYLALVRGQGALPVCRGRER